MPAKTLRVLPNPYLHLDHEGRPSSAVPVDPGHNPGRAWVGAHLCVTVLTKDKQGFATDQDTWFEFDLAEPAEVPNTHYYAHAVRHGQLIAADEATARTVGRKFADPATTLAESKVAAAKRFAAHYPDEDAPSLDVHAIGTHAAKLSAPRATLPAATPPVDTPRDLTPATSGETKPGLVSLAPLQPEPAAMPATKGDS